MISEILNALIPIVNPTNFVILFIFVIMLGIGLRFIPKEISYTILSGLYFISAVTLILFGFETYNRLPDYPLWIIPTMFGFLLLLPLIVIVLNQIKVIPND